ncbi:hypothetical protein ABEB36_002619 [Hypothenemus hampei]|uniref:tRNA/rRNA methyltransferase SpoU type domain-containing protein n=1 Tax=Hypothenemus hampei TaxID=57062 RepID=A0ABD1F6E7_HYPHA
MANLFTRSVLRPYQQIRFLPRFSDSYPEKHPNLNVAIQKNAPMDFELSSKEVKLNKPNLEPIKTPRLFNPTPSLVIRSGKKPENNKLKEKSQTITEQLIRDVGEHKTPLIDKEGHLVYTKMQNKDSRIIKIMSRLKMKQKENRLILLEGKRLIIEALKAKCEMEYILFSRMEELEYLRPYLPKIGRMYKMPYKEMQTWSNLTTNPGIMGVFQIPSDHFFKSKNSLPLTIICDNIREPSNLGAILRISSSVGCQHLILTKGCVDVWENKVLRSACGAHFKINISKEIPYNELPSMLPENANVFIADSNIVLGINENLPILSYFSIDFTLPKHVVLVIGGETEGISEESYKLAQQFNGARLNIPLSNGVDSLNSGTALGVIAFEIKRQLLKNQ